MDPESLNDLINELGNVNDESIPQWALLLMQCMKGLLHEFKDVSELKIKVNKLEENKRLSEVIDKMEIRMEIFLQIDFIFKFPVLELD